MKWKEKGIASHDQPTSEERSTYFTFSEIQISPKEEMEVNSLFLIIKAKLTATTFQQQEKKKNIKICYVSGQILPKWSIFLFPGNSTDYENEFLEKKNILRSVPLCLLHRKIQQVQY